MFNDENDDARAEDATEPDLVHFQHPLANGTLTHEGQHYLIEDGVVALPKAVGAAIGLRERGTVAGPLAEAAPNGGNRFQSAQRAKRTKK
jgi:hypothetical protein